MPRLIERPTSGLRDHSERVLTNAEILALPITPVEILTCPPGFVLGVVRVSLVMPFLSVAYGNIDPACQMTPLYTGSAILATLPLVEAAGNITALLATGSAFASSVGVAFPTAHPLILRDGIGLTLAVNNGISGAFTGGLAGQILQVNVVYFFQSL
jgi:hypothetical protein